MDDLNVLHVKLSRVRSEMQRVILGQEAAIEQVITCLVTGGHVLVEGVPGLGKTLMSRTLAKLVDAEFRRIQFTPDLLPSDIIGTNVFDPRTTEFRFRKGPVFTEVLLADEINRTLPKTQAALLEAMEERHVTMDGVRNPLPELFFVIGTQNPIEYEGTYPLPETQLDRFLMKVTIDYPDERAELGIIKSYADGLDLQDVESLVPAAVIRQEEVLALRRAVVTVLVDEGVIRYIRQLAAETRDSVYVQLGASSRAAVGILKASRALAMMRGAGFVTPEEVKDVAVPVLRHRVILRPEAIVDGLTPDEFLEGILRRVPVPR